MKQIPTIQFFSRLKSATRSLPLVFLFVASAWPARAQMTTGSAMEDFAKTFGISAKGWSVQQTSCSLGANALWPREEATFTFFVKPGQPCKGSLKVDVIKIDRT